MERTEIIDVMGKLKLFGMRAAFDEIIATRSRHGLSLLLRLIYLATALGDRRWRQ